MDAGRESMPSADWLAAGPRHWHLVGACGIGMAALALLLRDRGDRVSGCDSAPNALAALLGRRGIDVRAGHDAAHLAGLPDAVVVSTAVPPALPELAAARAAGVPVFGRGAVLAALTAARPLAAVCGAHGKSTTTAFTAQVLRAAGVPAGWYVGAEGGGLPAVAAWGDPGAPLVIEADESDGSLAGYRPAWLIVTNLEFDHAEHFADLAALEACYRRAAEQTRLGIFACADDPGARRLAAAFPGARLFGIEGGDLRAEDICYGADGSRFTLTWEGRPVAAVDLPAPGRHNVLNALAAAAAAQAAGVGWEDVARGLAGCRLPARRFEWVVREPPRRVISDYAHHPAEIAALVRAARAQAPRTLRAVFQPHRYSRTRALRDQFPPALAGVDDLVLAPVYAASEPPVAGGGAWDLYAAFRAAGAPPRARPPRLARSLEAAWEDLRRVMEPGDLLLVIGAGSVERVAGWARTTAVFEGWPPADPWLGPGARLGLRGGWALAGRTTLGVGGPADAGVEAADEQHLAAVVRWAWARRLPLRLLGGGSNVLAPDGGVRGVVVRAAGPALRGVTREGECVRAGAGASLASLLAFCEREGLAGLEFLEGIPGTVGGALRMNAGAFGGSVAAHVDSIRGLNRDGSACIVGGQELEAGYRRCGALEGRIAVEAVFRLSRGAPAAIAARRRELAARRAWWRGLRTAGSVFRNPAEAPAGRLLEEAGMKGARVGGASVSPLHANVITTGEGATASDVWALMQRMRDAVRERTGVWLEPEIEVW